MNGDETAERRIRDAEITATGDTITVRLPDMPTTVISGGGMNISGGAQIAGTGSVTVTIDAPTGTGLAARSQGGRIHQFGTATKVDADTSGGSIRVEHVTDELELNTSGGGIRIGIAECRAEARTSGGSVQATDLRRGGSLRTSGGDIRAHLTWRTSGGDVEVNGRDRSNQSRNV